MSLNDIGIYLLCFIFYILPWSLVVYFVYKLLTALIGALNRVGR